MTNSTLTLSERDGQSAGSKGVAFEVPCSSGGLTDRGSSGCGDRIMPTVLGPSPARKLNIHANAHNDLQTTIHQAVNTSEAQNMDNNSKIVQLHEEEIKNPVLLFYYYISL